MDRIFAIRLKELMEINNDTQQGLANIVGGTRQLISQYRNGDILPNADKIIKIANYYNVSTDYLLGLTDEKPLDTSILWGKEENEKIDRIQKHKEICTKLNEIYTQKNHDYGNSFGETYSKLGIISAVTRLTDKMNRITSLCTKEQQVKDESIDDTLLDLANYAIMTLIERGIENE